MDHIDQAKVEKAAMELAKLCNQDELSYAINVLRFYQTGRLDAAAPVVTKRAGRPKGSRNRKAAATATVEVPHVVAT